MMAITDPDAIASVFKRRPGTFRRGPRLVQVTKDLGFYGVFSANGDTWRRQRGLVMAGLDPAHLRTYLPALITVTQRLRDRWKATLRSGEHIDLLSDLMRYTVDVTTCLAFGQDINTMEQGNGVRIQQHLNVLFPELFRRIMSPIDFTHWLPNRKVQTHVKALQEAVHGFIAEARRKLAADESLRTRPSNLIQALVAARDAGSGLTDEDVSGTALTLLLAGEDTTANSLAWLTWLLFCNPTELDRLRSEVDLVVGDHRLVQSIEQLDALDYLGACANEALRLKPVAPLNIMQVAEDTEVAGVQVPAGVFVVCVMRPAGMEPSRFEEPQAFRPARWLEGAQAAAESHMFGTKRVVMPFGGGPRVCPGRYLALAEIKMVVAMLVSNFEIGSVWGPASEPRERVALTMAPVGLQMRLCPR
jgi:cytochrome P450